MLLTRFSTKNVSAASFFTGGQFWVILHNLRPAGNSAPNLWQSLNLIRFEYEEEEEEEVEEEAEEEEEEQDKMGEDMEDERMEDEIEIVEDENDEL